MKKIKGLIDKYHNKISTLIVLLFILSPLLIMYLNYKGSQSTFYFWYRITFILGCISGFVGIINLIINLKKNKINLKKIIPFILIAVLLILCFIAAIRSDRRDLTFNGEGYRHVGYYTYLLFLGFYINAINVSKKDYKFLGTILVLVSSIISVIALMNNNFTYEIFPKNITPYNGIFAHHNHFGYYLSITSIVAVFLTIYEKNTFKKIIYYIVLSLLFITLISNDTFGSYLGVLVSLLFTVVYSLVKKRNFHIIYILLLFISLSAIIKTSNGSVVENNFTKLFYDLKVIKNNDDSVKDKAGTSRMKLWTTAIKVVEEEPIFGVGPNVLFRYYNKYNVYEQVPHNFVLEMATYNGIPATIVYLVLLLYVFIRNLKNSDKYSLALLSCMISYLISALFGNMFFYTSPYFVILFGLLSSNLIICGNINSKEEAKNKIKY